MNPWVALILFFGSYIIGSIPFSYFIPKMKGIDIRKVGSGNIGATNVLRVMGPKYGIPAYLLDISKGLVPVLLSQLLLSNPFYEVLSAIGCVLGHTCSVFMKFRGGRGVAPSLGALIGMKFPMSLTAPICLVFFAGTFLKTRYISAGSLSATLSVFLSSIAMWALGYIHPAYLIFSFFGTALIFMRHRENIKRLLRGEELKVR